MSAAYLDTSVLVHALGGDRELRQACQWLLDQVEEGAIRGESSVLAVDELVHVRHRRSGDRDLAVREGRAAASLLTLHDVSLSDLEEAFELFGAHGSLDVHDAIHAAVAIRVGSSALISTDHDFDGLPAVSRIDPLDRPALEALAS